jgi:predicted DNA-binding transcriptional regulator
LPKKPRKEEAADPRLTGTTYQIYRYMLKRREPVGISQVQKDLSLASSSVSEYHLKKLTVMGLIREDQGGYVVDKVVLDNVIRIRRVAIPSQTAHVAFFVTTIDLQGML